MRHIPIQALQGRVRKVHIGGPRGFRMAYFVEIRPPEAEGDEPSTVVCPFFFSTVRRPKFDWDDFDWQGACAAIYDSLGAGEHQLFTCWRPGA